MQLPKDFWAYGFKLTNSHLFQQNLTSALHDNDAHCDVMLVLMLLQTVIEIV